MRGSRGRGGALGAEEGHIGQRHSEPSAQAFTPEASSGLPSIARGASCKSLGHRTGGVPEGGAQLSDTAVMCHHGGNTKRKTDSLAFRCSQSSRKADKETDWGGGWVGSSQGRLPGDGDAWAGS